MYRLAGHLAAPCRLTAAHHAPLETRLKGPRHARLKTVRHARLKTLRLVQVGRLAGLDHPSLLLVRGTTTVAGSAAAGTGGGEEEEEAKEPAAARPVVAVVMELFESRPLPDLLGDAEVRWWLSVDIVRPRGRQRGPPKRQPAPLLGSGQPGGGAPKHFNPYAPLVHPPLSPQGGELGPAEVARLVSELLGGLAHLHAHGLAHSNLRAANFLADAAGAAGVTGAVPGVVRAKLGGLGLTRRNSHAAAPAYVSPEARAAAEADSKVSPNPPPPRSPNPENPTRSLHPL